MVDFSGLPVDLHDSRDPLKVLKEMYLRIMMHLDGHITMPGLTVKFLCPHLSSILCEDAELQKAEAVAQFCLLCLWVLVHPDSGMLDVKQEVVDILWLISLRTDFDVIGPILDPP